MAISKPPFELVARMAKSLEQIERVHREGYSKEYVAEIVNVTEPISKSQAVGRLFVAAKRFATSTRTKPSAEEHVAIVTLCCIYRAYIEDMAKVSAI